ncbi:MAG: hypothetical protein ACYCVL_01380 [Gemmatimonadaceae bacterium]
MPSARRALLIFIAAALSACAPEPKAPAPPAYAPRARYIPVTTVALMVKEDAGVLPFLKFVLHDLFVKLPGQTAVDTTYVARAPGIYDFACAIPAHHAHDARPAGGVECGRGERPVTSDRRRGRA